MEYRMNEKSDQPRVGSLKKPWLWDRNLDRCLVILQSLFILAVSYRASPNGWFAFVFVMFLCFFTVPVVYLCKFYQGYPLNRGLKLLADQGLIPRWIYRRRIALFLAWLAVANPVIWIMVSTVIASVSEVAPIFSVIVLSIPWALLEIVKKKEYHYLAKYVE